MKAVNSPPGCVPDALVVQIGSLEIQISICRSAEERKVRQGGGGKGPAAQKQGQCLLQVRQWLQEAWLLLLAPSPGLCGLRQVMEPPGPHCPQWPTEDIAGQDFLMALAL